VNSRAYEFIQKQAGSDSARSTIFMASCSRVLAAVCPNDSDLSRRVFRGCEISWPVQTLIMFKHDSFYHNHNKGVPDSDDFVPQGTRICHWRILDSFSSLTLSARSAELVID
jgi:hypothetical protein